MEMNWHWIIYIFFLAALIEKHEVFPNWNVSSLKLGILIFNPYFLIFNKTPRAVAFLKKVIDVKDGYPPGLIVSATTTLAYFLFFNYTKLISASGPLILLGMRKQISTPSYSSLFLFI